jgi:hypothetical protein
LPCGDEELTRRQFDLFHVEQDARLVGLIYVAVVLVEIFLVGAVLVALTTWPLWRRLKKLERERDAKAREILERWRPVDRREPI